MDCVNKRGCSWGIPVDGAEADKNEMAYAHQMLMNTPQAISTLYKMVKQGNEDTQMSILELKQSLSELQQSFGASAEQKEYIGPLKQNLSEKPLRALDESETSATSAAPQVSDLQELDALIQHRMRPLSSSFAVLAEELRKNHGSLGELLARIENGFSKVVHMAVGPETKSSEWPPKVSNQVLLGSLHEELAAFQKSLLAEMHMQSAGFKQDQGGTGEYPSVQQSGATTLCKPEGGVGSSEAGQFVECDIGSAQAQLDDVLGGQQALQKVIVIADQIPVIEDQQADPTCAAEDAFRTEEEAIITLIEEEHEHQYDEDAHHKIHLKEESSMASVFMCDDDVERPHYDVTEFYYTTGICQAVAQSDLFQNLTVFVVILNALYIGIDADWNRSENIFDAHWFFMITSNAFCVYFTGELLIRFLAFENKRKAFNDGWFKFDTFLVVTMILDTWVIMPAMKLQSGAQFPIPVQPLRMLRLAKLTRMARLMKAFPELVTMIKGLIRSLRAISSSGILVGLMVYTWAILLHMLLKNEDALNQELYEASLMNFATIPNCMWILIVDGTLMLDNAGPVMTGLLFADQMNLVLAGIFFSLYALLSALLILQMLIGVLCDVVARVGQEQRDAAAIGLVKQELLHLLQGFADEDGKVNQHHLMSVMKHPQAAAVLKKLNINRIFLMELQKMMFPKMDSKVPVKAILELMIMCRGDNVATVEALSGGFCFLEGVMLEVKDALVHQNQRQAQQILGSVDNHAVLLDSHIAENRARIMTANVS